MRPKDEPHGRRRKRAFFEALLPRSWRRSKSNPTKRLSEDWGLKVRILAILLGLAAAVLVPLILSMIEGKRGLQLAPPPHEDSP